MSSVLFRLDLLNHSRPDSYLDESDSDCSAEKAEKIKNERAIAQQASRMQKFASKHETRASSSNFRGPELRRSSRNKTDDIGTASRHDSNLSGPELRRPSRKTKAETELGRTSRTKVPRIDNATVSRLQFNYPDQDLSDEGMMETYGPVPGPGQSDESDHLFESDEAEHKDDRNIEYSDDEEESDEKPTESDNAFIDNDTVSSDEGG